MEHTDQEILDHIQQNENVSDNSPIIQIDITERDINKRLAAELNGKSEVSIPGGRIDVLTETKLIEIKYFKNWLQAINQIMRYT